MSTEPGQRWSPEYPVDGCEPPVPGPGPASNTTSSQPRFENNPNDVLFRTYTYPLLYPEDTRSTWVRHWTAKRRVLTVSVKFNEVQSTQHCVVA